MDTASEHQGAAREQNVTQPGKTAPPPQASREAANAKIITLSGLFDAKWYVATYPDVAQSGLEPALHYIRIGGAEGRAPSPGFDAADYIARYRDVAKTGMNPLLHYVIFGKDEARIAKPVDPATVNARIIAESGLFDEAWYTAAYAEVLEQPLAPLQFFLKHGREKGHSPGPGFDARHYIGTNSDVAASGINPLLHYLKFGRAEGRVIRNVPVGPAEPPSPPPAAETGPGLEAEHEKLISESGLFDAQWYRRRYKGGLAAEESPALHYLRHGGAKGHAPSPAFHAADYQARYKDVREAGMNPLVHYLLFGKAENRSFKPFDTDAMLEALVAASGLYNEKWYLATYPEVARSKLSPLRHFMKHGREKSHHPGPRFDAEAYVAANADVAASNINPLVHYLRFGQAEGRQINEVAALPKRVASRPARQAAAAAKPEPTPESSDVSGDLALLEATPLFDKTWYLARYPEAAKQGMNPAEHYLRHGEMRQPSIFFDPQYYVIEQSPEIQHTAINPLVHYLKVGKALGRKPRALFDAVPAPGSLKPLQPSEWPLVTPVALTENHVEWMDHAELRERSRPGNLFIGGTLIAWSPGGAVLDAAGGALALFMEMARLDPVGAIRLKGAKSSPAIGFDGYSSCGLGQALTSGTAAIADAWFTSDRTLRVRFGDGQESGGEPLVIRAFHPGPAPSQPPVLAGEALIGAGGPEFADFSLATPFSPLLIVVNEPSGEAIEIGLLAFPSLCRGGHHYAELVGSSPMSDPIEQMRCLSDRYARDFMAGTSAGMRMVSAIAVGISHATGTERIFSPEMLGWITSVLGIPVVPSTAGEPGTPGEAHLRQSLAARSMPAPENNDVPVAGQFTLELPADAIPTIAALTARALGEGAGDIIAGSWLVAEVSSGRPRFSVAMPPDGGDLIGLQPAWAPQGFPLLRRTTPDAARPGGRAGECAHLAIRHTAPGEPNRTEMLMPLAPDSAYSILKAPAVRGPVDIVLRATALTASETFLRSLLRQSNVTLGQIRIECQKGGIDPREFQALADTLIPGRATAEAARGFAPLGARSLIEKSGSAFTLFADDAVVLHDTRTLEALTALAAAEGTASASCVLLREAPSARGSLLSFESGGYFPTHVSLLSSPRLMLSLPDCRGAFPNMTYPVIANDPAFVMLNNDVLRSIGSAQGVAENAKAPDSIGFSLAALAAGYRHLCTTAVRVAAIGAPPRQIASDPPGLSCFTAQRWENILGRIAVVRELH